MNEIDRLKVLFADTSAATYTDRTAEAFDFLRDSFTLPLETADFLYLGRRKPFNALYIEIDSDFANAISTSFALQYWNGTAWTSLALKVDDSKVLQRSGFLRWVTPVTDGTGLEVEVDVNGETLFWLRLSVGANITATTKIRGIGVLFADDFDLKREVYDILAYLPKDETETAAQSHVLAHVSAREAIIGRLRREGKYKVDAEDGSTRTVDEWDVLAQDQVRLAATYKALAEIFLQTSDSTEDVHWAKYKNYDALYTQAMDLFILSLDTDDDGIEDANEAGAVNSGGRFYRR